MSRHGFDPNVPPGVLSVVGATIAIVTAYVETFEGFPATILAAVGFGLISRDVRRPIGRVATGTVFAAFSVRTYLTQGVTDAFLFAVVIVALLTAFEVGYRQWVGPSNWGLLTDHSEAAG